VCDGDWGGGGAGLVFTKRGRWNWTKSDERGGGGEGGGPTKKENTPKQKHR
jgi:hypothetical protein